MTHFHGTATPTAIINIYGRDDRAAAEAYAAQIGGYVAEGYNEYGAFSVNLDDPEGKHVPYWGNIPVPDGFVLTRRGDVKPDDEVVSSHCGRRFVDEVQTQGTVGPGTTYITPKGGKTEAYPADSLIPCKPRRPRATTTGAFEYAAFIIPSNRLVGLGPTENRQTAVDDVRAWRADGYDVVLRKRPVADWADDEDQDF